MVDYLKKKKKTVKDELKKTSVLTAKPHTKLSFIITLRFALGQKLAFLNYKQKIVEN